MRPPVGNLDDRSRPPRRHPERRSTPAHRSPAADRKASRHTDDHDQPVRSFPALLKHLATLTRNDLRYGTDHTTPLVPTLAEPTPTQRHTFALLNAPIPLTINGK
ncbi:MAG: hypothetical protein V9G19_16870 [Tetrasphaera sp.]